jgi:hypothetical protein
MLGCLVSCAFLLTFALPGYNDVSDFSLQNQPVHDCEIDTGEDRIKSAG